MKKIFAYTLLLFFISGCEEEFHVPKPRAYPRIIYPEKTYQGFKEESCDFLFEYPTYAKVEKDEYFFDEKHENECWFDIVIPDFNAKIHCSYYEISKENNFEKLRADAFRLAMEHKIKANFIDELPIEKSENVKGFVFDIEGSVASPLQFYLSDEKEHFIRGALYVNAQSKPDSLAPIYDFLKQDVMQVINTFEWK